MSSERAASLWPCGANADGSGSVASSRPSRCRGVRFDHPFAVFAPDGGESERQDRADRDSGEDGVQYDDECE
jgi:hypothetical protein